MLDMMKIINRKAEVTKADWYFGKYAEINQGLTELFISIFPPQLEKLYVELSQIFDEYVKICHKLNGGVYYSRLMNSDFVSIEEPTMQQLIEELETKLQGIKDLESLNSDNVISNFMVTEKETNNILNLEGIDEIGKTNLINLLNSTLNVRVAAFLKYKELSQSVILASEKNMNFNDFQEEEKLQYYVSAMLLKYFNLDKRIGNPFGGNYSSIYDSNITLDAMGLAVNYLNRGIIDKKEFELLSERKNQFEKNVGPLAGCTTDLVELLQEISEKNKDKTMHLV